MNKKIFKKREVEKPIKTTEVEPSTAEKSKQQYEHWLQLFKSLLGNKRVIEAKGEQINGQQVLIKLKIPTTLESFINSNDKNIKVYCLLAGNTCTIDKTIINKMNDLMFDDWCKNLEFTKSWSELYFSLVRLYKIYNKSIPEVPKRIKN